MNIINKTGELLAKLPSPTGLPRWCGRFLVKNNGFNKSYSPTPQGRTGIRIAGATKIIGLLFVWLTLLNIAVAISPEQLKERIKQNDDVVIIDIRLQGQYRAGHIPGAINIPSKMIANKTLPRFGDVVVCDSGLGREDTDKAVAALRLKPGLVIDVLDGGYAGWLEAGGISTGKSKLRKQHIEYITYKDLKQKNNNGIVFVDLRKKDKKKENVPPTVNAISATDIDSTEGDIFDDFPGVQIITDPFAVAPPSQQSVNAPQESPLYVLVDTGDGTAQTMARALKANKNRHVVVLLGGEKMIKRKGRTGLQRIGPGIGLRPPDVDETVKNEN